MKKPDSTLAVYLGILVVLLAVSAVASRKVVFRPWTDRTYAAVAASGPYVYAAGGMDRHNDPHAEILRVDVRKSALRKIGELPAPLYSASAVCFDGVLYIAGGSGGKNYSAKVWRCDPETGAVRLFAVLPAPRCYGAMVAVDDALYYIGGFDGKAMCDEVFRIDPQSAAIELFSRLPEPLEFHGAAVLEDAIFIIGGENRDKAFSDAIYRIDVGTGVVEHAGSLPEGRGRFGITQAEGSVYLAGGWGPGRRADITRIDDLSGSGMVPQFSEAIEFPEVFSDFGLIAFDGCLYLVGGVDEKLNRQLRVIKYDLASGEYANMNLKSYSWR